MRVLGFADMLHDFPSTYSMRHLVDRILRVTLSAPQPCTAICPLSLGETCKYHITQSMRRIQLVVRGIEDGGCHMPRDTSSL